MSEEAAAPQESYKQKLERILAQPDLLQTICDSIANGGSIVALARLWDVQYSHLCHWLNRDKERATAYIQALNDRAEWCKETMLNELRALALSDIRQAFDANGRLKPMAEIPEAVARALASVETFEEYDGHGDARVYVGDTKKIKFWNKPDAIATMMKHLGMLIEKHQVAVGSKLEDLLAMSHETPKDPPPAAPTEEKPA